MPHKFMHAEPSAGRRSGCRPHLHAKLVEPHLPPYEASSHLAIPNSQPLPPFCHMPQGEYVVLAAEPVCICGCDVAAPRTARPRRPGQPPEPLEAFFRSFEQQFTAREWEAIRAAGGEGEQEGTFRCGRCCSQGLTRFDTILTWQRGWQLHVQTWR